MVGFVGGRSQYNNFGTVCGSGRLGSCSTGRVGSNKLSWVGVGQVRLDQVGSCKVRSAAMKPQQKKNFEKHYRQWHTQTHKTTEPHMDVATYRLIQPVKLYDIERI